MNVTREVVYDLLPGYFANEVSADTRALVEEYFHTDPEFARMATRFSALIGERRAPESVEIASVREREAFERARSEAELPQKTRAAALVWGFASLFAFGMAVLTWNERMAWKNPGVILGLLFGVMALAIFTLSFRIRPDSWWRGTAGLDDDSLNSMGFRRRRRRELSQR